VPMPRRPCLAGVLCALLSPVLAAPAYGAQDTSASCTFIFPNRLSPGFTLTSSTGTYGSGGETGTITCLGSLDGHRVTGPGTFGFEGVYTGDCFGNVGSGTYFFTIPTDVGSKHFTGSYTERRTGFNGPIQASQPGGRFQGVFLALPQKGDCLTSPVTEVVINMAGTFRPGSVTPERRTSPSPSGASRPSGG
ncbi:MAG TPA: hypothetical protein VG795_16290, partial [Acidimicrobiia bacterium]|nr:hypothetical protein [Acidimicrobiia bacterium]